MAQCIGSVLLSYGRLTSEVLFLKKAVYYLTRRLGTTLDIEHNRRDMESGEMGPGLSDSSFGCVHQAGIRNHPATMLLASDRNRQISTRGRLAGMDDIWCHARGRDIDTDANIWPFIPWNTVIEPFKPSLPYVLQVSDETDRESSPTTGDLVTEQASDTYSVKVPILKASWDSSTYTIGMESSSGRPK